MTVLTEVAQPSKRPDRLAQGLDWGERAVLICLYFLLVQRLLPSLSSSPVNGLLIVSETIVVGFVVCRRQTSSVTRNPADWLLALSGTLPPLFFRAGGFHLMPQALAGIVMIAGILTQVSAKLFLRRSFGIVAANRGVKMGGPYLLVRHPMYLGYAITWVGFLSINGLWVNLALASFALVMQVFRILIEERLLRADPAYSAYMTRVRYRIIPGLF
jgi:protein-S-isoprenylcysteine O-methyltransferase Ste14